MFNKRPKIILIGGANWLGDYLINTIITNGGEVILIDYFNSHTSFYIKKYLNNHKDSFSFFDKSKFDISQFNKISYILNIQTNILIDKYEVSSRKFVYETAFMDSLLAFAANNNCRFLHISTIKNHKKYLSIDHKSKDSNYTYGTLELQHYLEMLVLEYVQKASLDGSILRIADLIGPGMELSSDVDNVLLSVFKDAVTDYIINIKGDGLNVKNFVYIDDAVNGILLTLFTENISGRKFSLMHEENPTLLSIASKILEFPGVKANNIKFVEFNDDKEVAEDLYLYIPDPNITEIGWETKIPVYEALYLTFNYYLNNYNDLLAIDLMHENKSLFLNKISKQGSFYKNNSIDEYRQIDNKTNSQNFEITLSLPETQSHQKIVSQFFKDPNLVDSKNKIILNKESLEETRSTKMYKTDSVFKNKNKYISIFIFTIISLIVFLGIVLPIFKIISFFNSVENSINDLVKNINVYSYELKEPNLLGKFRKDLYFLELGMYLTGKVDYLNNIKSGLNGLDRTFIIYEKYRSYKTDGLFNKINSINEDELFKLKLLETESRIALDEIKLLQNINLNSSVRFKIDQIIKWLENNILEINNYQKFETT